MSQQSIPAAEERPSGVRRAALGVGLLIVAPLLVVGCASGADDAGGHRTSAAAATPGTSRSTPVATPSTGNAAGSAQKLADLDGLGRPAAMYQQVLDALAPRCKEDRPRLAAVIASTLDDLKKNGVDDEDGFGILQHMEQAVPAGKPRVTCTSAAAAYATERKGG
ncbi:hypothetical protein [Streptomyces sp. NPDC004528]|uniref:hypothetical protein n=1 Tax=Streptomyces sp. NPDC004528 TaxID=3154550 RepID=UPI0033B4AB6F